MNDLDILEMSLEDEIYETEEVVIESVSKIKILAVIAASIALGALLIAIIKKIKEAGKLAGLSIKPKTPTKLIKEYIPYLDLVLIMTVEPGFGGQKFMHDCVQKIADIKEYARIYKKENIYIQADGGINDKTSKICTKLGANSLVAGSYIFNSDDMESALKSLL